jgi:error-prone DNA polymerase
VVFQNLFEEYRKPILQSKLLMVEGQLQREGEVIHVIVQRCHNFTKLLRHLTPAADDNLPLLTLSRSDEKTLPASEQGNVFYGGRNFR